ncbi:hypothetical protein CPG37_10870 [Malaciobacter canalis]|uniref:Uncharacterized protein n=1 Tax=Malaciobacter canalis TaxID=1912871 RepID=A0ABX4LNM5_9BACT|nr:hypothetical protein [Malaciobacter canalis]PHO09092.1 hypothetical protein CPG37_10870 [Malaciobacter canalis]QEE31804.1 hypothetical protein ACAN_0293 [Malaciobacter canalis]
MGKEKKKRKIIGREVAHHKDEKFTIYSKVLLFLIENPNKSFTNTDIREKISWEELDYKKTSFRNMFNRCIDFYIESRILIKLVTFKDNNNKDIEVLIIKDDYDREERHYYIEFNGKTEKINPQNTKVRLYDKEIDGIDENGEYYDDDYVVDLHIPKSRDGRKRLCETVSSMITTIPNVDIYSPTLKTVLESQLFGFNTDFVSNTIGRVILKHHNIQNKSNETNGYPLDVIMSIIHSKLNVDVKFENFGNTIQLKNTKIKKVSIKENGFDIHFDNFISQNQSDIKQILSIENSSEDGLRDDIKKLEEMINELPSDDKEKITKLIGEVTPSMDLFEF